jgi:hypothetical protein
MLAQSCLEGCLQALQYSFDDNLRVSILERAVR